MEYWYFLPLVFFLLGLLGTNFEVWSLRKEIEQLKKQKKKKKK